MLRSKYKIPQLTVVIFFCLLFMNNLTFGQNRINDSLIYQLQLIEHNDQDPRIRVDSLTKLYANDSLKLMAKLKLNLDVIRHNDSINLMKVTSIIDKYGWLGPEEIGDDGCQTLFIVIQHADLQTQEKYFPVLKAAVRAGKARQSRLAILEDRILLRKGQKQIYGSQLFLNIKTNEAYVLPLEDPYNLDTRRASVGLEPMANYIEKNFNAEWDISKYFKSLPTVDSLMKMNPFY
jgi:hypothetical protein